MSKGERNRRRRTEPRSIGEILAASDGATIPGVGCGYCNAYQTVRAYTYGTSIHRITVHHDEWCTFWQARRAAS